MVLSIVGVDRSPDYDYYVAKLAQEQTTARWHRAWSSCRPPSSIDFAGQMLGGTPTTASPGSSTSRTQPVDTAEIASLLLDLATGAVVDDVELAGPQEERLLDQVRTLVERSGSGVRVEAAGEHGEPAASMLPGPDALLRGPLGGLAGVRG